MYGLKTTCNTGLKIASQQAEIMSRTPRILMPKKLESHNTFQEKIPFLRIYITDIPIYSCQWIPLILRNHLIHHML